MRTEKQLQEKITELMQVLELVEHVLANGDIITPSSHVIRLSVRLALGMESMLELPTSTTNNKQDSIPKLISIDGDLTNKQLIEVVSTINNVAERLDLKLKIKSETIIRSLPELFIPEEERVCNCGQCKSSPE